MKIAILADPLDNQSAGVHVYTRELVNALAKTETQNEYLIIRQEKDPNLPFQQIAVPNTSLPIGFASLRLFFIIPFLLRFHQVDAVFEPAHFGPFNLPKRIMRITMIHDLTPILMPEHHRTHSQFLQRTFLPGIIRKSELLFCNSASTQSDLEKTYKLSKDKIKMIPLGVSETYQATEKKSFLKSKRIDRPYFLYVGTIEPRKNLVGLLEAFAQFKQKNDEPIQLILVGKKGWKTEAFYEALASHPFKESILELGYIEDVHLPEMYSNSLALIYPSLYEGFGLPVIEAMACGTNVIIPNNSSLPEVGGKSAYYYDTNDTEALCAQMLYVSKQNTDCIEKRQLGIEWSQKFSWIDHARTFDSTIEQYFNARQEAQ